MTKISMSKIFFTDIEGFSKWYSLSVNVLANIRPNIRHILGISLLPLFHPYGRYLALFYIYGLDLTLAYIRHSQSSVFIARGIITGCGHDTAQPRAIDAMTHNPFSHQYVR